MLNEIRKHGVNLIENIWPHGMMLTGRVKHREGKSWTLSRYIRSEIQASYTTGGEQLCHWWQLLRSHAFSWPWLPTAACHLASHQSGDTTKRGRILGQQKEAASMVNFKKKAAADGRGIDMVCLSSCVTVAYKQEKKLLKRANGHLCASGRSLCNALQ